MNQRSNFLTLRFCLLASLICLLFQPAIGAQDKFSLPNNSIPKFTARELLIRVTPKAQSESERFHAKSALQKLHNWMGVLSFSRVFPHATHPESNPNLERIYLLRFPVSGDMHALKAAYAVHPFIEAADFNYLRSTQASDVVPNDPQYEEQWNLPLINMPQAWGIEKGNPDVVIAIVDTGFDYTHEDLAPKTWVNVDEIPDNGIDDDNNGYIDDVRGWDFTDALDAANAGDFLEGDNDPIDESGHGTHVAGIAGAAVDNGIGVAGIAWNCTLMSVRAGTSLGGGTGLQDNDSASAIVYAVDNGARVINMSWGSRKDSFVIRDAINYAYIRGVVLVAAAGNEADSEAIFPAGYRNVIAVAATQQHKQQFYRSNFGATVDIGAPGNVILSTQLKNRYRLLTGTSMATAHVSGVAGLIISKRPNLTHDEVRQILVSTADEITESPGLVGAGHLNAERALMASSALQARILSPEANGGESNEIKVIGTAGGFKFDTWQLQYGESAVPTAWEPINTLSRQQRVNETLFVWETSTVPEGIYTIRLEVSREDGKAIRDEVVVAVDRTPPRIRNAQAREWIYRAGFTTVVTWSTDDFTIDTLSQRSREGLAPFAPIAEDTASREHIFSLPLGEGSYDFFITSRNAAGLETVDNNNGQFYRAEVIGRPISPNGFVETSTGLPPMHLASVTADFDRDSLREIIGWPLTDTPVSGIQIYEQSGKTYQLRHTGTTVFEPWAVDDTDDDGLLEILGSTEERTFLIESVTRNGYPERIIWESLAMVSAQIDDLDGDGRKEIIGADNNNDRIRIFENRGNDTYEQIISLKNETDGSNVFGERFAISDFDGDGRMELLAGDSEGELFIYESIGDDLLIETWRHKIDVVNAHQLAVGDLTGDGVPELVVGGTVSEADLPSLEPRWEYHIFTASKVSEGSISPYTPVWVREMAPFRLRGNAAIIADIDGDSLNELVILANPSIYVFEWTGDLSGVESRSTFNPIWHHGVRETPQLVLADLNENGFSEIYFNDQESLFGFEHARAGNPNTVAGIQPWGVSATPLNERVVQVTWVVPTGAVSFTVYRAIGTSDEELSNFEMVANDLDFPSFLDRKITKDTTYWYAVAAKNAAGVETDRTEAVSVTPRTPPRLISAEYLQSNQVSITFDKRMNSSVGDKTNYLLREPEQLAGVFPHSAIRDRMGARGILTFRPEDLVPGRAYEITVSNVQDIDRNPIDLRGSTQTFDVPPETDFSDLKDFTQTVVFPNPVRPNEFHKSAVTFNRLPIGATIEIYNPNGDLIEKLTVTESDRSRKEWLLLSNGTIEVTSGIYIYAMEFENRKKIGKIAVIK